MKKSGPLAVLNRLALAAILSVPLFAASTASADINTSVPMGNLSQWTVFSLGGGVTSDKDDMSGSSQVYGDVGVAGNGNINMSGSSIIHGNLWYRTNGKFTKSGSAMVTGATFHDAAHDSALDTGVTSAINASNTAASYAASTFYAGLNNINVGGGGNLTILAQHDRPGNSTVLSLTNFNLSGGSTLTLDGGGDPSANFVLNITGKFTMSASSQILLTGGTTWDDVLFNIRGTGSDVAVSGSSMFRGILMANQRKVNLTGSTVSGGRIIANQVILSGSAIVVSP